MIFVPYIISIIGGLIPVLVWLWFWEHEDKNPEPHRLTVYAFLAGMVAVILVIPFEKIALDYFGTSPSTIFLWAVIEESFKLIVAYVIVLRRVENDEPIDSFMYMMAVALGFSALENALFIFPFFHGNNILTGLVVDNFRFLGASMLHTICSGTIGIFLGSAYYKSKKVKFTYLLIGLMIAILLHTLFNLGIVLSNETSAIIPFFAVWLGSVIVIISLERVKQLQKLS